MLADLTDNVIQYIDASPGLALGAVFLAGLLTAASPCVLAMIPLMMSFVAGQEDQVFIRAGYGQGQTGQPAGMAVGMGIHYQQFEIEIGKSLSATNILGESEPVQITFGVIF